MPLYASISDLAIGIAWVQSLKSVDYNALVRQPPESRLAAKSREYYERPDVKARLVAKRRTPEARAAKAAYDKQRALQQHAVRRAQYRKKKEERDPQQGETVQVGDALNDVIVNNQTLLRELERR